MGLLEAFTNPRLPRLRDHREVWFVDPAPEECDEWHEWMLVFRVYKDEGALQAQRAGESIHLSENIGFVEIGETGALNVDGHHLPLRRFRLVADRDAADGEVTEPPSNLVGVELPPRRYSEEDMQRFADVL